MQFNDNFFWQFDWTVGLFSLKEYFGLKFERLKSKERPAFEKREEREVLHSSEPTMGQQLVSGPFKLFLALRNLIDECLNCSIFISLSFFHFFFAFYMYWIKYVFSFCVWVWAFLKKTVSLLFLVHWAKATLSLIAFCGNDRSLHFSGHLFLYVFYVFSADSLLLQVKSCLVL